MNVSGMGQMSSLQSYMSSSLNPTATNMPGMANAMSAAASIPLVGGPESAQKGEYEMSPWLKMVLIWMLLEGFELDLDMPGMEGLSPPGGGNLIPESSATPSQGVSGEGSSMKVGPAPALSSFVGGTDASGAVGLTYGSNGMMAGGAASLGGMSSMAGAMMSVGV